MSIVAVILSLSSASDDMTEVQHTKALEYLSVQLALRDRREIIDVLCHHNPDHMTEAIRMGVAAYEPMIRQVHQAVDLSATLNDLEAFMNDMIKLSKPSKSDKGEPKLPSVEDYVQLLHTHQGASHRFINQVAKNGKEVTAWFNDYTHEVSKHFQSSNSSLFDSLSTSYSSLSKEDQAKIQKEIDNHAKYLEALHDSSATRIRDVLSKNSSKSSTPYGPGAYLARWQQLLDSTLVTPATMEGSLRRGANKSVKSESSKDIDGVVPEEVGLGEMDKEKAVKDVTPEAPSTEETVKALGPKFRELLRERL